MVSLRLRSSARRSLSLRPPPGCGVRGECCFLTRADLGYRHNAPVGDNEGDRLWHGEHAGGARWTRKPTRPSCRATPQKQWTCAIADAKRPATMIWRRGACAARCGSDVTGRACGVCAAAGAARSSLHPHGPADGLPHAPPGALGAPRIPGLRDELPRLAVPLGLRPHVALAFPGDLAICVHLHVTHLLSLPLRNDSP